MTDQTQTQSDGSGEESSVRGMQAPSGRGVYHVQLRITERDDGYEVTEPGVDLTVVEEDVHDAVSTYAELACDAS
jgi:hypothetical protein